MAQAGIEREPGSGFQLIFHISRDEASRGGEKLRRSEAHALLWIVTVQSKELMVLLGKPIEPTAQIIAFFDPRKSGLAAFVFGSAVFRGGRRRVLRAAFVVRGVVVVER